MAKLTFGTIANPSFFNFAGRKAIRWNTVGIKRQVTVCIVCLCAVVATLRAQSGEGTSSSAAEEQVRRVVSQLKELNPGYDGKERHKIKDGMVTELSFSTEAVSNISPVRALTGLQSLDCSAPWWTKKGILADLSSLKGLPLHKLNCGSNPQIKDLSPLQGMPLTDLEISLTSVSDLSPLQGMQLSKLLIIGSNKISDLSPLKGMPLVYLDIAHTSVGDLSPLQGMPIAWLDANDTKVTNLAPLQGMPLTSLRLPKTKIPDLSPLKGMPLTGLAFFGTTVSDLSPLKDLPLKTIYIDFVSARDAVILHSIKTLEKINGMPVAEFWNKPENQAR